ncbi:SNF2-related protein [uncultured Megasphaera sp.]|uniref:SNF2-related protein n=1 Tax=uncultured Megasphaera sp. TaxID=165188 RepID=UPI0025DA9412|nr:SNF2-related protein [uncultured Megasphaera sp.]
MDYTQFIAEKERPNESSGFEVDAASLPEALFDFQRDIVRWSLAKGRAAIFADCGLGKTLMQLAWAGQVHRHTGKPVLILAPLAVAAQTAAEGKRFGIDAVVVERQSDVVDGINITNYDKLDRFDTSVFAGVVLDESSILKSFTGKVRTMLIQAFSRTPYRLACTATPAPNDYMELGNHSEFLGVMSRTEMLSMFFVHDGGDTAKWRLKGHAETAFWRWMAGWAVVLDNPTNLGYEDNGYELPPLRVHEIIVDGDTPTTEKLTLTQRRNARKESLEARCQAAADLVNTSQEQWLVWCDLNAESERLYELCRMSRQVIGSDKAGYKSSTMLGFSVGVLKCLVTKPKIAGFGMNWQNCHNMVFVGLSDSYEQYYQAVRRCWRFGQTQPVDVYIIISAKEGAVKENIERKEADAINMRRKMAELTRESVRENLTRTTRIMAEYKPMTPMELPEWAEMETA